jgi:hypothetical protein
VFKRKLEPVFHFSSFFCCSVCQQLILLSLSLSVFHVYVLCYPFVFLQRGVDLVEEYMRLHPVPASAIRRARKEPRNKLKFKCKAINFLNRHELIPIRLTSQNTKRRPRFSPQVSENLQAEQKSSHSSYNQPSVRIRNLFFASCQGCCFNLCV